MATRSLEVDENKENRGKKKAPINRKGRKAFAEIQNVNEKRQTRQTFKKNKEDKEETKTEETIKTEETVKKTRRTSCEYFNVKDYVSDIFAHLKTIEIDTVGENHLEGKQLTSQMRMILIDWLVDIHSDFKLLQETLNLCVHILDVYLEKSDTVSKYNVELYALASLLIASKYHEIQCMDVATLIHICEGKFDKNEFIKAESNILKLIDFNLGYPMLIDFIRRYSALSEATPVEHSFAKYFSEVTLLDDHFCHERPSLVAAACSFLAFCVSREEIDEKFWPQILIEETRYDYSHFSHLVAQLAHLVVSVSDKHVAIKRKYSKTKMYCVSIMPSVQPETGIINKLVC